MKNQPSTYYIIAAALILIGLLMLTDKFSLNTAQMNILSIGAALITLSTAIVGLNYIEKANIFFIRFIKLNFYLGIIIIFIGFLLNNFRQDIKVIEYMGNIDSNPLVLVCLGITIGSIVLVKDYNRKKFELEKVQLDKKIKKLENEKQQLEREIIRASAFLEGLEGWKND